MKKFLTYIFFLVLSLSCNKIQPDPADDEDVLVNFCVSSTELILTAPQSKAVFPLDPSVENTIDNIWVLQYAEDGRLLKSPYTKLPNPVLSTTLQVRLAKSRNSTVIIVANMGGVKPEDENWPSDKDFKWGEHGGGSLYDLQNKLFNFSLENPDMPHMFMTGITLISVDDENESKTINMMLSRLASKFRVSINSATENSYSHVRLQMINCPVRFSLFPNVNLVGEYCSDMVDYAMEEVTQAGEYLTSSSFISRYYYANENISPENGSQTMLRVIAVKEGREVSTLLPVSSHETTFRNTYYNIQVTLK